MRIAKSYPKENSPFFRLQSPHKLAELLGVSKEFLEEVGKNPSIHYEVYNKYTNSGKLRNIEEPKDDLKRVQRRIHELLIRIDQPSYLHSVKPRCSYITNAKSHYANQALLKIDIKDFFPSVKKSSVSTFFLKEMECSADVAELLAKIVTKHGRLPTGGNSSPIMSFYAKKEMFEEIAKLTYKKNLVMSVYVDDICVSGPKVSRHLLHQIKKIIGKNGMKGHKAKIISSGRDKIITGVKCTESGLDLPPRRHKAIHELYERYRNEQKDAERLKMLPRLMSMVNEAAQIDPAWKPKANNLRGEHRKLKRKVKSAS